MAALALLPSTGASEAVVAETTAAAQQPVKRVLSLDLCTDWMLVKYAQRSQILALSPLIHQYPVEWVGQSWPTHDGSLEQILELKPDLVITGEYNALILRERLKELGVRVAVLALPKTLSEINDYERHFLSLIGEPTTRASTPPLNKNNRSTKQPTLLLLGANGIGTGTHTFEDGILQRTGWQNYLTQAGYVSLDLEQLATNPPNAVLWSAPRDVALANLFAEHPVLQRAVPKDHWLSTEYWYWQCPGPWTWQLIDQLQGWLH